MSDLLQKVEDYVTKEYSRPVWIDFEYHNLQHIKTVVREVKELASLSNLSKDRIEALEIASWFHDLGYDQGAEGHEKISFEIAKKFLKKHNVSDGLIDEVENLIKATRTGFERYQTVSQKIIRDADLSNAGLKGFKKCSNALRHEWAAKMDRHYNDIGWSNLQIQYLTNLNYLSEAGIKKYSKRKKKNLKKYRKRLAKQQLKHALI